MVLILLSLMSFDLDDEAFVLLVQICFLFFTLKHDPRISLIDRGNGNGIVPLNLLMLC